MSLHYRIKYKSKNTYENPVSEAYWQFLVTPENNETQEVLYSNFRTTVDARIENSINGYNFETTRIHCKKPFDKICFEAEFRLHKKDINPFGFSPIFNNLLDYNLTENHSFKVEFDNFLKHTELTKLPENIKTIHKFNKEFTVFENLNNLNNWVYNYLQFKIGVTKVNTLLKEIVVSKQGVCQDFSHLFCAISRENNIPARYVSGYLHQGNGYFGDSQMHAWVEAFLPNIGWIGFDPTNNILVNHNHIKVCHGKDYNDCPPIKGIIYASGKNETTHSVEVSQQQ
ncbi:MAG: transglutaminase family protein [Flaviramulus sp.]|nr:transglutaminase family protein [Flaviramulus sp.]